MVYMARITNLTSLNVTGRYRARSVNRGLILPAGFNWFKIWEDAYTSSTGTWGMDRMVAAKGLISS
jgi:hypothetical protein